LHSNDQQCQLGQKTKEFYVAIYHRIPLPNPASYLTMLSS
jgi:hypothetical protein